MRIKCVVVAGLCAAVLAGCDRKERSSKAPSPSVSAPAHATSHKAAAAAHSNFARQAPEPVPTRRHREMASPVDREDLGDSPAYRWAVAYLKRIDETLDHDASNNHKED